jgi:hypothetical protein
VSEWLLVEAADATLETRKMGVSGCSPPCSCSAGSAGCDWRTATKLSAFLSRTARTNGKQTQAPIKPPQVAQMEVRFMTKKIA